MGFWEDGENPIEDGGKQSGEEKRQKANIVTDIEAPTQPFWPSKTTNLPILGNQLIASRPCIWMDRVHLVCLNPLPLDRLVLQLAGLVVGQGTATCAQELVCYRASLLRLNPLKDTWKPTHILHEALCRWVDLP